MSQLTIVVISIALSAIIGLIGINYVGPAFLDAKDKATALQYVAQGAQIATAWKVWSKANGTKVLTQITWFNGGSTDLVPNYLTELPTPLFTPPGLPGWMPFYLNSVNGTGSGTSFRSINANVNGVVTWLETTKRGDRICKKTAEMSQGTGATPFLISAYGNGMPRNNAIFDCFYFDLNGSGTIDIGTDSAIIVYRVF